MHLNKLTAAALDQKIVEALGTTLKATATLTLNGTVYKAKDLQQQFQAEVDAAKATQSAKTAYAQAVLAEQQIAEELVELRKALRAYLVATYGAKSATVAEFGFNPKTAKVDVATKAAAIAKRKATKAARGAKGSSPEAQASTVAPVSATESAPVVVTANGNAPKAATTN